ncbi:MAG: DUF1232 domain-containing protein [Deltaproteobacteria bacterium]
MSRIIEKAKREMAYYRALIAHPGTPGAARWLVGGALAYLLSPVDLIPDWIPVLGVLDDLVIVPGLICAALLLIPPSVKKECREKTADPVARSTDTAGKKKTQIPGGDEI